jgi:hypothetical protein
MTISIALPSLLRGVDITMDESKALVSARNDRRSSEAIELYRLIKLRTNPTATA